MCSATTGGRRRRRSREDKEIGRKDGQFFLYDSVLSAVAFRIIPFYSTVFSMTGKWKWKEEGERNRINVGKFRDGEVEAG